MSGTCRLPTCSNDARGWGPDHDGYVGAFCSTGCELKYDHVRADARDGRLADEGGEPE